MKRIFLAVCLMPLSAYASTPEQRGFQVYRQVCSTCHSLNYVTYSDFSELGLSVKDIKDYAAQHQIPDGVDDDGDAKTRPAKPSDHVGSPYPGESMARMANHGSLPPDFSRLAIVQDGGAEKIIRILQSYAAAPKGEIVPAGSFYNSAVHDHHIAMPQPLHDGQVTYQDGTKASVSQMAQDVAAFLEWSAHPHQHTRHRVGYFVLGYLAILTTMLVILKKRIWSQLRGRGR